MKPAATLIACAVGCAAGLVLGSVLRVTTDPAQMEPADHRLAYRLLPVLGVLLAAAIVARVLHLRVVFWGSLTGALASLLIPEPNPGHVRYGSLENAAMASLGSTSAHCLTVASSLATLTALIAIFATFKLVPAIRTLTRPKSNSSFVDHNASIKKAALPRK